MTPSSFVPALLVVAACFVHPAYGHAQDRWLARDKAAHFGATLVIAGGSYGVAALVTEQPRWKPLAGVGSGVGAAAAKELWDRSHGGHPSWRDFAWSAVGTAAGVTVAWLIDRARGKGRSSTPRAASRLELTGNPALITIRH